MQRKLDVECKVYGLSVWQCASLSFMDTVDICNDQLRSKNELIHLNYVIHCFMISPILPFSPRLNPYLIVHSYTNLSKVC